MVRLFLSLAAAAALVGCAPADPPADAGAGGAAFFTADVTGADALFPVAARSAALRRPDYSTGGRKGDRVCVRAQDVRDLSPLVGPSLAAMRRGPVAYTQAPRDYARAVNDAAFRVLLTQDEALAAATVATIVQHSQAEAWLPAERSWTAGSVVIEGMGPLLPAWQILRQARSTSPADRAAIDAWIARLAVLADERESENNLAAYRGANNMLLGLMTGDGGRYAAGRRAVVGQLAAMRPDGSFPLEVERGAGRSATRAGTSGSSSMPLISLRRLGTTCGGRRSRGGRCARRSASFSTRRRTMRWSTSMRRRMSGRRRMRRFSGPVTRSIRGTARRGHGGSASASAFRGTLWRSSCGRG